MSIGAVTDETFRSDVLEAKGPVFVDFSAKWCGPCKMLAPVIEKVADKYKDKVKFYNLDIDESPNTTTSYEVRGVPTLLIIINGELVSRSVGYVSEQALVEFIEKAIEE